MKDDRTPKPGTTADTQPFGFRAPDGDEMPAGPVESANADLEFGLRSALTVRETFPDETLQIVTFRKEWTVTVRPERIVSIMKHLRDHWNYKLLHDVTSVDLYPREPRFMVVYHLLNLDRATRFRVKALVAGETPEIDSVYGVWPGADFMEREVFDLMGIRFAGHPDLRRILMPEDWDGHPLRKDYPLTGHDVGVDTLKD